MHNQYFYKCVDIYIFSVAIEYQFTPVVKMLDPPQLLTGKVENYLNGTLMDASRFIKP